MFSQVSVFKRDHQDLAESKGNSLTNLIGSGDGNGPPAVHDIVLTGICLGVVKGEVRRGRHSELLGQIRVEAHLLNVLHLLSVPAKRAVMQKTGGIFGGGGSAGQRWRWCRNRHGLSAGGKVEESQNFPVGLLVV